jgi:DNA-binding GntR family transcriptional regulator
MGDDTMRLEAANRTRFIPSGPQSRRDGQQEIVKRLEEDIIFGRLAPGSRLVEDALMARYGGTRHTVRQALLHLDRAGIVTREKNIGATVRSFSPDEVRQIYEVREMLTRQAILMIPLPAPDALIHDLSLIQTDYRRLGSADLRALHEVNDTFHITLFAACGNPYLVQTLRDYMGLTLPMRAKNLADSTGLAQSRRQHELMIELLAGRDSWALAQLSVEHMQFSKTDYLKRIPPQSPET